MTAPPAPPIDQKYEDAISRLVEGLPPDIADKIVARRRSECTSPRVAELEFLLQERFTPERVRELMQVRRGP